MRRMLRRQTLGGAVKVDLDDLGRAGADEEQLPDIGAAFQQTGDGAVDLVLRIGHSGQVRFLEDGGAEARFGEDHHAGRRLQQVRAGAAAHHEKERVLHLAVQPDDAGQAAEHLALATFLEDGRGAAAAVDGRERRVHAGRTPPRRAWRSFHRN